tara:strand:+ start:2291 stop:3229 length:939 start_codon:yes stop_codon:yes gene_type:complete
MHLLDTVKKHLRKISIRLANRYYSNWPNDITAFSNDPNSICLSQWWQKEIPHVKDIQQGEEVPTSTTVSWYPMDSEEHFDSLPPQGPHFKFNKDNVRYTLNSYGYRGLCEPTASEHFTVLVIGDSHTFGMGLDDKQIWPSQFQKLLQQQYPRCRVINLSLPGASNDYIARMIYTCMKIIQPDCVIPVYTYPNRREAIWDSGLMWQLNTTIPKNPVQAEYEEFQSWFMTINEHTDYYNQMKNHIFIESLCKDTILIASHVIKLGIFQHFLASKIGYYDVARDCKHYGPVVHKKFAYYLYDKFCSMQTNRNSVK